MSGAAKSDSTTGSEVMESSGLSLTARLEAVLLAAERSLGDARLAEAVSEDGAAVKSEEIRDAVDDLNAQYEKTGRVFRIIRIASGWRVMTIPEAAPVLKRLLVQRQQSRLTPATLETLAIIAYRQPVMRAEIEAIRGVACGDVLRGLLERRLVRIAGRAEELGRPMLYGTTREFLKVFGLAGIDDLPEVEGLPREPSHRVAAAKPSPESEAKPDMADTQDQSADADAKSGESNAVGVTEDA
ncbi:MAG: SMC-Scp complex subunit ScpB [Phycisphaerae bacterium]|nr:SMC-Scp complex subunit ScpB [Phycisphaerae bacterium]